jgi:enoyl-CoA hydratase
LRDRAKAAKMGGRTAVEEASLELATEAEAQVIVERRGGAGIIRLNRPKAINSLTLPMVRAMFQALHRFEDDPGISCVVLAGEGERGLCAGGDVRIIHDLGRAGDPQVLDFWREEFPLNYRIARFGKPYVALMDGIVMGGGVGISAHGSHRIVTERTKLAMPETGIGYFPDVGGSWLLPKAPGECGTWLGLTGNAVTAADAIYAGFADHLVPSEHLADLVRDLSQTADAEGVEAIIGTYAVEAGEGVLAANREIIDATFRFDTVEEIFAALSARDDAFSRETLEALQKRSPTSLKLTLKLLRLGRESASLIECLEREFAAGTEILRGHDFYEGVRAALVDKDRSPRWQPARLEEVRAEDLLPYFAAHSGNLFPRHRL